MRLLSFRCRPGGAARNSKNTRPGCWIKFVMTNKSGSNKIFYKSIGCQNIRRAEHLMAAFLPAEELIPSAPVCEYPVSLQQDSLFAQCCHQGGAAQAHLGIHDYHDGEFLHKVRHFSLIIEGVDKIPTAQLAKNSGCNTAGNIDAALG